MPHFFSKHKNKKHPSKKPNDSKNVELRSILRRFTLFFYLLEQYTLRKKADPLILKVRVFTQYYCAINKLLGYPDQKTQTAINAATINDVRRSLTKILTHLAPGDRDELTGEVYQIPAEHMTPEFIKAFSENIFTRQKNSNKTKLPLLLLNRKNNSLPSLATYLCENFPYASTIFANRPSGFIGKNSSVMKHYEQFVSSLNEQLFSRSPYLNELGKHFWDNFTIKKILLYSPAYLMYLAQNGSQTTDIDLTGGNNTTAVYRDESMIDTNDDNIIATDLTLRAFLPC